MKNLYQPSKIVSLEEFAKIEKAFEKAWSLETTYPDIKFKWSKSNKALGQCAPTALIVYDMFGGRLIYDKATFHIWNELPDGTQQDFSRIQFQEDREFSIYKYKTKEDVLYDKTAQRTDMVKRYTLLKQRFQQALKELGA